MPGSTRRASLDQEKEAVLLLASASPHRSSLQTVTMVTTSVFFLDIKNENGKHVQLDQKQVPCVACSNQGQPIKFGNAELFCCTCHKLSEVPNGVFRSSTGNDLHYDTLLKWQGSYFVNHFVSVHCDPGVKTLEKM